MAAARAVVKAMGAVVMSVVTPMSIVRAVIDVRVVNDNGVVACAGMVMHYRRNADMHVDMYLAGLRRRWSRQSDARRSNGCQYQKRSFHF
jgi:hypothetical protein